MTKRVRIENADNSSHVVIVEVWGKGGTYESGHAYPDMLQEVKRLENPTDMCDALIYKSGQYIIIREE